MSLSDSVVLSPGQLASIRQLTQRAHGGLPTIGAPSPRALLKARSAARYRNWSNTLEAVREKKKLHKLSELANEEARQRVVDQQEAAYQEAQRRRVIDRANRIMYQNNDRVKNFENGLILAEVIKEREAQIELKAAKRSQSKLVDQQWAAQTEQNLRAQMAADAAAAASRADASHRLQSIQLEQLREYRARQVKEREEEMNQGMKNKQLAQQALEEARAEEAKRIERMREFNGEYTRANSEFKALSLEKEKRDRMEEQKIEEYAKEKERLTRLRAEAESARQAARTARQADLIARQYSQLKSLKDQEEQRINKQIIEIEIKEENHRAQQMKKREEMKEIIRLGREQQIARHNEEAAERRRVEAVQQQEWNKKALELEQADQAEKQRIRELEQKHKQFLLTQMRAKEEANARRLLQERQELDGQADAQRREDEMFERYVHGRLSQQIEKGRSIEAAKTAIIKERTRGLRAGERLQY